MRLRRLLVMLAVAALSVFAVPAVAAEGHGEGKEAAAHGEGHESHDFSLKDINWFYGMIGVKEGVQPNALWRPPGMPAPFGALLINAAILYLILFRMLSEPITQGLKSRKETIMRGMDEAAKMKREAKQRLREFEDKLEHIDDEVERLRSEMREVGELERVRILSEAKERRARMERDAHLLIEQERKAARELLMAEAGKAAVAAAAQTIQSKLTGTDQQRMADEYLAGLRQSAAALRGRL
ncbi:MAG TPA: ATP synthase F0 subunit B [Polyangiaceae bacterium]|nr:ATP synthase F0 subunit B [Polyangiaceae bacterium]